MTVGRAIPVFLTWSLLAVLAGCGSPTGPQETPGDPGEVENLVYGTTESWADEEAFQELFADDVNVTESMRKSFQGKVIHPQNVEINGDTATIEVILTTYVNNEPQETTLTWQAKKVGDSWKLTEAPLK